MLTNAQKVLIGVVLSLLLLGGSSALTWHLAVKVNSAEWVNKLNKEQTRHNAQVKLLNRSISTLESEARTAQEQRTADYLRGVEDGKNATEDTIAKLRRTNSGLWLQVRTATERASNAEAAAVQSKRNAAKAAQLTTEASESLIRIAADGDTAIRQLQLCQVEYKALYEYNNKLFDAYQKLYEAKTK